MSDGVIGSVAVAITPDARDFFARFEAQTRGQGERVGRELGREVRRGMDEELGRGDTIRVKADTGEATAKIDELQRKLDTMGKGGPGTGGGISGLIKMLAPLAPALVPTTGAALAAGAAFATLGGTAMLAIKGIQAEMKKGTPIGKAYTALFSGLWSTFGKLEAVAAKGLFSGISQSIKTLAPVITSLVKQTIPVLNRLLPVLANVIKGLITDLGPAIKVAENAFVGIAKQISVFFNSAAGKSLGQTLAHDFKLVLPIVEKLASVIGSLLSALSGPGQAALKVIGTLASGLQRLASAGLFKTLGDALTSILTSLRPVFKQLVNAIVDLVPVITPVIRTIAKLIGDLAPFLATVFRQIGAIFKSLGPELGPMLAQLARTFKSFMVLVEQLWKALGPTVTGQIRTLFRVLLPLITTALKGIEDIFRIFSDIINGKWGDLWKRVKDLVAQVWKLIVGIIKGAWGLIWNGLKSSFAALEHLFGHLWDVIVGGVKEAWHVVAGWFHSGVNAVLGALRGLGSDAAGIFSGIVSGLSSIASSAENVLGLLTRIGGTRNVGPGLGSHIPGIGGHATGGRLSGPGTGTSDSIPAWLSNGEFVVNARQTSKHLALLEAINRGIGGFASGALVSLASRYHDWNPRVMAAIADAESGSNAHALNNNPSTGDLSYGLWQINMIGSMGPARRRQFGISNNAALFNPSTNVMTAHDIWRGSGYGAWSTYNSGAYRQYLGSAGGYHGGSGGAGGGGSSGASAAQQRAANARQAMANLAGGINSWRGSMGSVGSERSAFHTLISDVKQAGGSARLVEQLRDENDHLEAAIRRRIADAGRLAKAQAALKAAYQMRAQDVSAIKSAGQGFFDITSASGSGGPILAQEKQALTRLHQWVADFHKIIPIFGKTPAGKAMLRALASAGLSSAGTVHALADAGPKLDREILAEQAQIDRITNRFGHHMGGVLDDRRIRHDRRWVEHRRDVLQRDRRHVRHDEMRMERHIAHAIKDGIGGIRIKVDARGVVSLYHTGVKQNAHSGRHHKP